MNKIIQYVVKKNSKGYYYDTSDGKKYLSQKQVDKLTIKLKQHKITPNKIKNSNNVYIFNSSPNVPKSIKKRLNKGNKIISKDDQKRIDDVEQSYRSKDLNTSLNNFRLPSIRYLTSGTINPKIDYLKHEDNKKIKELENKMKLLEMEPKLTNRDKKDLLFYRSVLEKRLSQKELEDVEKDVEYIQHTVQVVPQSPKTEEKKSLLNPLNWFSSSKKVEEEEIVPEQEPDEEQDEPTSSHPSEEEDKPDEPTSSQSYEIKKSKKNNKSSYICPVCGKNINAGGGFSVHLGTHISKKELSKDDYDKYMDFIKLSK